MPKMSSIRSSVLIQYQLVTDLHWTIHD